MAASQNSIPAPASGREFLPLSSLFRDPAVRLAFQRAEREDGAAFAVPSPSPRPLLDGALLRQLEMADA